MNLSNSLQREFDRFHAANPHVYEKLKEIALFVRRHTTQTQYGIAAIFERLRWVSEFETKGNDYKLNNNFRAFYSRLLMKDADLRGFFRVRRSIADW